MFVQLQTVFQLTHFGFQFYSFVTLMNKCMNYENCIQNFIPYPVKKFILKLSVGVSITGY